MALFNPRTYPEIIGEMINHLIATTPLTDVNYGSVFTTMLEAAAQEDDEQYFQMIEIIRSYSLDTTTGVDLDNRAFEYGLSRLASQKATTKVTIGDSKITKVETGVYSGLNGSPAGANYLYGDSATNFPTTGAVVVGRGTPNVETVNYSSITVYPNYVKFNLSTSLAYDHGTDETIILSQGGNRIVPAGVTVKVPAGDFSAEVSYITDSMATILDGESEVIDIGVTAVTEGANANVPIGSIIEFESLPFAGAYVTNPSRVTNGKDVESDQELRDRIKSHIQSLSRGTSKSIISGTIGIISNLENKRVISASIIEPTIPADVVRLYIDDGTGYIPSFEKVGFETVVPLATGGEKFVKSKNSPIMKAFVETAIEEPFVMSGITLLFVEVGGQVETITFDPTNFENAAQATAQEVLTVINANASLIEARLSNNGTKLRIFSRSNYDEQIQVTGGSANNGLNFPTDLKYTTKLYRKRAGSTKLLSKDGVTASIESGASAGYNMSLAQNLCLVVDGKVANPSYVEFSPSMFSSASSVLAKDIATIIEAQVPGLLALATSNSTRITLKSNTARSANSKIRVVEDYTKILKYNGAFADITSQCKTSLINVMFFDNDNSYIYLGHIDVKFQSIYFDPSTPASAPVVFVFEFFDGLVWRELPYYDETDGFTQRGFITFKCPSSWTKTNVNGGDDLYYVRLKRDMATLAQSPVEKTLRICSANEVFLFNTTEKVGVEKEYTLNRFLGQIELVTPLQPNDELYLGSTDTRALMISNAQPFGLSGGEILQLSIDGVSQSITFDSGDFFTPGAALASEVLARLNKDLRGAVASLYGSGRIQITSTAWENGSVRALGGIANSVLQFTSTLVESIASHIASLKSQNIGPYTFPLDNSLIVIMDQNSANNFIVPFFREGTASAGSASHLVEVTLFETWPLAEELLIDGGFDIVMKTGANAGVRRKIANYVPATGTLNFSTAMPNTIANGDIFQIMPSTAYQIEKFLNNKKISLISTQAEITASDGGQKMQIASLKSGEVGSVYVSGGNANAILNFSTLEKKGVDAYRYFIGLAQEVQWTIDGKEDDDSYEGIRAAGTQVEVLEPIKKPILVGVDVTPREGVSLSSISNEVKSAISSYINTLPVGGDVIVSEIIVAVKGVSGVADVKMTTPTSNIAIADSELARIDEKNISVG